MLSSVGSRFAANVLIFNCSPRSNNNTMKLLKEVAHGVESVGKTAEIVQLSRLKFKPCQSCLECKRPSSPNRCVIKDDLQKYLDQLHEVDAFAIGSPIYMGNPSAYFYSFFERAIYSNFMYTKTPSKFGRKIKTGLVFSMGASKEMFEKTYWPNHKHIKDAMEMVFGPCAGVVTNCTQVLTPKANIDYEMPLFDMDLINNYVREHDPIELKNAFNLGVKLASK